MQEVYESDGEVRLLKSFSLGIGTLAFVGFMSFYSYFGQQLENFAKREIPVILEQQREILGMNYAEIPELTPMIFYPDQFAVYEPRHNRIRVNALSALLWPFELLERTGFLTDALHHEFAHAYIHQRWGNAFDYNSLNHLLIDEGIAEYVGCKIEPFPHRFYCQDLSLEEYTKRDIQNAKKTTQYLIGKSVVKPIIDQYKARGIDYLVHHPPKEQDLDNLQQYQKRVLDELARID